MCGHGSVICSFLLLHSMPFTDSSHSIPQLTNIWVFPVWDYVKQHRYRYWQRSIWWTCIFIGLSKYLEVELLDHMVKLCLLFEETADCFQKQGDHYIPQNTTKDPVVHSVRMLVAILVDVRL